MPKEKILQVALDFTEYKPSQVLGSGILSSVRDFFPESDPSEYPIRMEFGTPLIHFQSMKDLSKMFGYWHEWGVDIIADFKLEDWGGGTVKELSKYGIPKMTILANASDNTFKEALSAAKEYGIEITADLIDNKDPYRRIVELQTLGVDEILIHQGLDTQTPDYFEKVAEKLSSYVDIIDSEQGTRVAIAGGVTPDLINDLKNNHPEVYDQIDVFVVGGYFRKNDGLTIKDSVATLFEALDYSI